MNFWTHGKKSIYGLVVNQGSDSWKHTRESLKLRKEAKPWNQVFRLTKFWG